MIFPALGPKRTTQAKALTKVGVAKVRTTMVCMKFFKGMSVLETAHAMGTPMSMLIMSVPRHNLNVFSREL